MGGQPDNSKRCGVGALVAPNLRTCQMHRIRKPKSLSELCTKLHNMCDQTHSLDWTGFTFYGLRVCADALLQSRVCVHVQNLRAANDAQPNGKFRIFAKVVVVVSGSRQR